VHLHLESGRQEERSQKQGLRTSVSTRHVYTRHAWGKWK
jgi:hypothetical protein